MFAFVRLCETGSGSALPAGAFVRTRTRAPWNGLALLLVVRWRRQLEPWTQFCSGQVAPANLQALGTSAARNGDELVSSHLS